MRLAVPPPPHSSCGEKDSNLHIPVPLVVVVPGTSVVPNTPHEQLRRAARACVPMPVETGNRGFPVPSEAQTSTATARSRQHQKQNNQNNNTKKTSTSALPIVTTHARSTFADTRDA